MSDKTRANYRLLVKEIFRLIRARTQMNMESDTDAETDAYSGAELNA